LLILANQNQNPPTVVQEPLGLPMLILLTGKRCEKGKYQGQEGQSQCLQCPPGTTTLGFGSNDLSDSKHCKAIGVGLVGGWLDIET